MANSYTMMDVTVTDIQQLTPLIKQFTFQKSDGSAFLRLQAAATSLCK